MKNLSRRLERLEKKLWDKSREFLPGLYVHVLGEPLTSKELEELREKYRDRWEQQLIWQGENER